MTEVKPDQQAEDGQAVASEDLVAREPEALQSSGENFEQSLEPNATLDPQADETAQVESVEETQTPVVEELAELETNGDERAEGNGVLTLGENDVDPAVSLDTPSEDASQEQDAEKPKGFFRRRVQSQELKKLKTENEKLAAEVEAYRDRYIRLAAEMENFRKRTDRDFYSRVQGEVARMIVAFLPLVDDLERCLHVKDGARDYDLLLNGVRLIHQNFSKILSDYGVTPMAAVDKEFDPNLHDALTEMASAGKPAGVVLEEHNKGYLLRDKVLRPAKVIVSR